MQNPNTGAVSVQTVTIQLPDMKGQSQVPCAVILTSNNEQQSASSSLKTIVPAAQVDEIADDDKKKIYRHPLLPLLTLLLERCEKATQSPDSASTDSFNSELNDFMQKNKDIKTASNDGEIDNLMLKTIQVLRIHLLELEKVNELCKDFCSRYIACLKSKLQSEAILREAGVESDDMSSDGEISPPRHHRRSGGAGDTVSAASAYGPGHIVSGGTVYQMVQTPQGLVAQPIQVSPHPVVHGSTPLSQIGASHLPDGISPQLATSRLYSMGSDASDDEDQSGSKKLKRGTLSKHATQVMKSWLFQHIVHPYPTEEEKKQIGQQTNLTLTQVNNWFINARRRILQPMLDASNPEGAKTKKSKPQSRPAQRFWPESLANINPQVARQIGSGGAKALQHSASSPPVASSPEEGKPLNLETLVTPAAFVASAQNLQSVPVLTMDGSQQGQPVLLSNASSLSQVQLVQTSMGLIQLVHTNTPASLSFQQIQLPDSSVALMVAAGSATTSGTLQSIALSNHLKGNDGNDGDDENSMNSISDRQ